MDEPLIVAAIISMIALLTSGVIGGMFAYLRGMNNRGAGINPGVLTSSLLTALQAQTKALADLTEVLRQTQVEERQAHGNMEKSLALLLDRTGGNPE